VVNVVVLGTSPEWQEVVQAPREVVTTMRIDGLEYPKNNPDIHCHDVKVAGNSSPADGHTDGTKT